MRVVHAIPYASALDVFAGDLVVFDAVNFKSVTSYRALDGKRYAFALRPAGMTSAKPLASNTEGLQDGSYYTVFALPGDGRSAHMRIVTDKLDRPADGKLRLRIVHAGDGVGAVDVRATANAATLFEGVGFQTVSDYQEIGPVNGPIEIRVPGWRAGLYAAERAPRGGAFLHVGARRQLAIDAGARSVHHRRHPRVTAHHALARRVPWPTHRRER